MPQVPIPPLKVGKGRKETQNGKLFGELLFCGISDPN